MALSPKAPWQYVWGPGDNLFVDHKLASKKQKITDMPQNTVQDTLALFRSFFEGGIRSTIGLAGPSEGDWRSSGFRKQQSTHPRGVRLPSRCIPYPCQCFNPRTHAGCDFNGLRGLRSQQFQSTHPRGVRQPCSCQVGVIKNVSIHAPTRGATP